MSLEIVTVGEAVGVRSDSWESWDGSSGEAYIFSPTPVEFPQIAITQKGMLYVSYVRNGVAYKQNIITAGNKVFFGEEEKL